MFPQSLSEFFNLPFFTIIGGVSTSILLLTILYALFSVLMGVTPLVIRIGKALWLRKIALFGNADSFMNLSACLIDSGVFKKKNIEHIPENNIEKGKSFTVFLVDWESSFLNIDKILASRRNQNTAVVIYAKPGSIPIDKMAEIANQSNTVVVNFRGRLLNDLINSMLTTSFDRN